MKKNKFTQKITYFHEKEHIYPENEQFLVVNSHKRAVILTH
jgi:hypothetical protein